MGGGESKSNPVRAITFGADGALDLHSARYRSTIDVGTGEVVDTRAGAHE